jgi:ABC-type multidrug transport system permease subunit
MFEISYTPQRWIVSLGLAIIICTILLIILFIKDKSKRNFFGWVYLLLLLVYIVSIRILTGSWGL